jgi:hypothetical protein
MKRASFVPLLLLACSSNDPVQKPEAPDMSALVQAYAAPTAPLTRESAAEVLEQVTALLAQLERLGIEEQLLDTIDTTIDEQLEQTSEPGSSTQASTREHTGQSRQRLESGEAYLIATRICAGFGPEPVPDRKANGAITLNMGLTGDSLDSVLWGAFQDCKYLVGESEVRLAGAGVTPGTYAVYVGDGVKLKDFTVSKVLLQLSLWAEVDGEGELVELDFYLDLETRDLELRVPLEDGYVIAQAGASLLGVRASNGDFVCDAEARSCDSGDEHLEF